MPEQLHPMQKKILLLFKENENKLPSFRELAKQLGVSSTNTVAHHIKILKSKGFLIVPGAAKGHIVPLSIRAILNLKGVPGVFVILEQEKSGSKRLLAAQSENMGERIMEAIFQNKDLEEAIRDRAESLRIAFYGIESEEERVKILKDL